MCPPDERLDSITRVLSLPLPEAQWRALLDVEPEPVAWLRQQIRERLAGIAGTGDSEAPRHRQGRGDACTAGRAS